LYNTYIRRGIFSKGVATKPKPLLWLIVQSIKYALKHRLDFQPFPGFNLWGACSGMIKKSEKPEFFP
jgi:hypothetical protein